MQLQQQIALENVEPGHVQTSWNIWLYINILGSTKAKVVKKN